MANFIDLTEESPFGLWKVVGLAHSCAKSRRHSHWNCICLGCNNSYEVAGSNLRSGKSTKCANCAAKERNNHLADHSSVITEMRNKGYSFEQIGKAIGVSKQAVYQFWNKKLSKEWDWKRTKEEKPPENLEILVRYSVAETYQLSEMSIDSDGIERWHETTEYAEIDPPDWWVEIILPITDSRIREN